MDKYNSSISTPVNLSFNNEVIFNNEVNNEVINNEVINELPINNDNNTKNITADNLY